MSDKKLLIKLAADVEGLKKGLRDANTRVESFAQSIQKVGNIIGVAFSAQAIGQFAVQISKLAGEAQGVKAAFDKLPDSIALMQDLKNATGGTVSELDLMKRSVMASNFDISLKALPKLLEFATLRARQTGQSVNYLVDSIVTGIGRKSKLILDNLGISAVQLTEALGGASTASSSIGQVADAVGKIAEKNLKTMGGLSDDAAVKIDRLSASWTNLKVSMGELVNNSGASKAVEFLDEFIKRWNIILSGNAGNINNLRDLGLAIENFNNNLNFKTFSGTVPEWKDELDQITEAAKKFGVQLRVISDGVTGSVKVFQSKKIFGDWIDASKKAADVIRNEKFLTETLNSLREESKLAIGKERAEINKQIQSIEKEIAALQKLGLEKKKAVTLDFSGLAGKNTALPSIKPKTDSPITAFFNGMSDSMFEKFHNEAVSLRNENKLIAEASEYLEKAGLFTQKGLTASTKAFSDFLKDKNIDAFKSQISGIAQSETKLAESAARIGDVVGESFGAMASGAQSFAQALSNALGDAIDALERYTLAQMVANSAKFGPVGIALAAAGFGLVKSIFKNIGSNNNRSVATVTNGGAFQSNGQQNGMYLKATVSGRQLNLVLAEQKRYDSRTNSVS